MLSDSLDSLKNITFARFLNFDSGGSLGLGTLEIPLFKYDYYQVDCQGRFRYAADCLYTIKEVWFRM